MSSDRNWGGEGLDKTDPIGCTGHCEGPRLPAGTLTPLDLGFNEVPQGMGLGRKGQGRWFPRSISSLLPDLQHIYDTAAQQMPKG